MNFKMTASDFQLLSKFIERKAKGSDLKFMFDRDQVLEITITMDTGEDAKINFFSQEISSFPKITRSRNLGDEL